MDTKSQFSSPEIWGGIECTINRVGDRYFDQLAFSGHYERPDDISLIAGLGISAIRVPVLWEKHQPLPGGDIDWAWTEKYLLDIREHGITPIAGLVHHGSGPAYTNLLDENFASGLENYALSVATKFPWIDFFTPVNEPLTTARFSGLYGLWYPHHKNEGSFARMLVNQLKATVLSMRAIRSINPNAKLIQTEDLGKTYSTQPLHYQAMFENHRRWLTFDFLCGAVLPGHPLWTHLVDSGISEEELMFFHENPCPPDVLGMNYYITSERYLDHEFQKYPPHTHGGNNIHRYADVEAVRVVHGEASGLDILLREAWGRFKLPMALTEVHLHCTREDQLRWFREKYETCCTLVNEGIPVKAVTAWSLFGAFGWNRLLTHEKGDYEPGVFSVLSGKPRPTALATYIRSLTKSEPQRVPLFTDQGWWHRNTRFLYEANPVGSVPAFSRVSSTPVLIIGKTGTLGRAFARICEERAISYRLLSRQDVDICNESAIERAINFYKPWAIVNAAGYVRVDDAEDNADRCYAGNTKGPELLTHACKRHGIKLLCFSSDLVFDGRKGEPYVESDAINPLNVYGRSKADMEQRILLCDQSALVVRTSAFFGPWDQYNFVNHVVNSLVLDRHLPVMKDVYISPTYVPDLVNAALDLLIDEEQGIWHISNEGKITWADMAYEVARIGNYNRDLLMPRPLRYMNLRAERPVYSVLKSEKGIILPSLENALNRYFDARVEFPIAEAV